MADLDTTRYHRVRYKASHNSYEKDTTLAQQLAYDPDQPWEDGCRGLELDLNQSEDERDWLVKHVPGFSPHDATAPHFKDYLGELDEWSSAHAGHDPITVVLDLKEVFSRGRTFVDQLDGYIDAHFDAGRLFRPTHFWDGAGGVWPTIGELRGKMLFVLSGKGAKASYARVRGVQQLCFADMWLPRRPEHMERQDPDRVFINMDAVSIGHRRRQFIEAARNEQFVIRLYGLNDARMWREAQRVGVNMMGTDGLTGERWASVVEPGAASPMKAFRAPARR